VTVTAPAPVSLAAHAFSLQLILLRYF